MFQNKVICKDVKNESKNVNSFGTDTKLWHEIKESVQAAVEI